MRKTSYVLTFLAVVVTLLLNILSVTRTDWLVYKSPTVLGTKITFYYGLNQLCQLKSIQIPDSDSWTNYSCRRFPVRKDDCRQPNDDEKDDGAMTFCEAWTTAGYAAELGIGFAAISLIAILVGVSAHSRRRRIWRAVAALVGLQATFQAISFGIVTNLQQNDAYPTFENARPGPAYILNIISWVVGLLITIAVVTTGLAADRGHKWAAGNRAYTRIEN